ncbi:cytochrome P450 [Hymenopellis radicata]|nr:cytochrome P450 [Hymenopellis radicata]
MPFTLTPGALFISKVFLHGCIYVAGFSLLAGYILPSLSKGSLAVLSLICAVAGLVARRYVARYRDERTARSLGARLAPRIRGKLPLNFDVLLALDRAVESGYPCDAFQDYADEYGAIYDLDFGGFSLPTTVSPKHIQAILATQFDKFEKGPTFRTVMKPVLGSGIFNADGDMWRFHRTLSRPFFSRDRVTHFDIFDRHALSTIQKMKDRLRLGAPVDFQDLIQRFTMDTATEFLFGACVNSLSSSLPYPHDDASASDADTFSDAFLKTMLVLAQRERTMFLWPLLEIKKNLLNEHLDKVNAYIYPIIDAAMQRNKQVDAENMNGDEDDAGDTLLDHLVRATDGNINILIAGRDTTASTLSFVVYFLATHPEVMARLRAEVFQVVGPHRQPGIVDVKELKYMKAVINETLRLFPPVPANVRETVEGALLPPDVPGEKPIYVPPHTQVVYSVMVMHRRKDLWGPDADEFDPDRFLDERNKKYFVPNPFIFLPFNAGPRICIGQQFAFNEMSFMLVRLMQNFRSFTLNEDASSMPCPPEWGRCSGRKGVEKIFPKVTFTLYIGGGLWIGAQEADDS